MTPVSGIPCTMTVVRKSIARFFPAPWALIYDSGASANAAAPARRELNFMLNPDWFVRRREILAKDVFRPLCVTQKGLLVRFSGPFHRRQDRSPQNCSHDGERRNDRDVDEVLEE